MSTTEKKALEQQKIDPETHIKVIDPWTIMLHYRPEIRVFLLK